MSNDQPQPDSAMTPKRRHWSVGGAARIVGALTTAGLLIVAVTALVLATPTLDFGSDLVDDIEMSARISEIDYPLVCVPVLTVDEGNGARGLIRLDTSDGVSVGDAILGSVEDAPLPPPAATPSASPTATPAASASIPASPSPSASVAATVSPTEGAQTTSPADPLTSRVMRAHAPVALAMSANDAARVSTTTVVTSQTDQLNGVALDHCVTPVSHAWFPAASTSVGHSAILTVVNPASQASDITIDAWGSTGRIDHTAHFSVAARSTETVNLATYFPGEERLAIHAQAGGPGATLTLHTSSFDGLSPTGMNSTSTSVAPSEHLIIPGFDPTVTSPVLRLLAPGADTATVTVNAIGPEGTVPVAGAQDVTIDAGAIFELNLDGIDANTTAIAIDSDEPVTGAIIGSIPGKNSTSEGITTAHSDTVMWLPAGEGTQFSTLLPITASKAMVTVANPGDTAATVMVGGDELTLTAHTAVSVDVTSGTGDLISDHPVMAALTITMVGTYGDLRASTPLRDLTSLSPSTSIAFDR